MRYYKQESLWEWWEWPRPACPGSPRRALPRRSGFAGREEDYTKTREFQTAIHEAGHAVVGHHIFNNIWGASIINKPPPKFKWEFPPGVRDWSEVGGYICYKPSMDRIVNKNPRGKIILIMAAEVAVEKLTGYPDIGAHSDRMTVDRILYKGFLFPRWGASFPFWENRQKIRQECMQEAKRMVDEHWDQIWALACTLYEKKMMMGEELDAFWRATDK